jgi:hypothetical protein
MDPLEADVLEAQLHDTTTLQRWKGAHGISYRPGGLWWKNDTLVIVGNDDLKRGVLHRFHDHIAAGHPGITKHSQLLDYIIGGQEGKTSSHNISKDVPPAK